MSKRKKKKILENLYKSKKSVVISLFILPAILIFSILFISFLSYLSLKRNKTEKDFISTEAVIYKSDIKKVVPNDKYGGEIYYQVYLDYEYIVDYEHYQSFKIFNLGLHKDINKYGLNHKIEIYYDPDNPSESVIFKNKNHIPYPVFMILGLAILMCAAGIPFQARELENINTQIGIIKKNTIGLD